MAGRAVRFAVVPPLPAAVAGRARQAADVRRQAKLGTTAFVLVPALAALSQRRDEGVLRGRRPIRSDRHERTRQLRGVPGDPFGDNIPIVRVWLSERQDVLLRSPKASAGESSRISFCNWLSSSAGMVAQTGFERVHLLAGEGRRACWREAEAEERGPWPSPEGERERRHARARRLGGGAVGRGRWPEGRRRAQDAPICNAVGHSFRLSGSSQRRSDGDAAAAQVYEGDQCLG